MDLGHSIGASTLDAEFRGLMHILENLLVDDIVVAAAFGINAHERSVDEL